MSTKREPNGQLSPHGIMTRPLGPHTDPIEHEIGLMLNDYKPSLESVEYARYAAHHDNAGCLTNTRIMQWLHKVLEFTTRYPDSVHTPDLQITRWVVIEDYDA